MIGWGGRVGTSKGRVGNRLAPENAKIESAPMVQRIDERERVDVGTFHSLTLVAT